MENTMTGPRVPLWNDSDEKRSCRHARAKAAACVDARTRVQVLSLVALLGATAALYIVGLSASGYANEFYSAAAQAGSTNWWSFLWGSSDAGNSITVDKPPAAIWPMALAVRIFGLSSWAILLPQAIMGVLCVWVLYGKVRRAYGHWAGILAGAIMATTPVACLMFRFNNPDALLMLLLVSCVYCVMRACELPAGELENRARTRWMALAGVAMGFAFLTKQLQAFLILPGIGVAFLVASPTGWRRKLGDTLAAFGALVVSAGWWVLLTVLVPAGMRPYIGGSQTNSFLELTFSYNGLGRITGSMEGAVLPGGGAGTTGTTTIAQGQAGMWGQTGITRLFDGVWGTQWSWMAWVALAGIVVGLFCTRGEKRQSLRRSNVVAWGGWLLVTGLVFSFMGGTIHQYYTVALAPAVGALVAICVACLWERRCEAWARVTAAALIVVTVVWAVVLLECSDWMWQLRPAVLALAAAAIAVGAVPWRRGRAAQRCARVMVTPGDSGALAVTSVEKHAGKAAQLEKVALGLALASALVGPVAYSLYTASTGHTGSIVTAGPSVQGDSGMGGGPGGAGGTGGDADFGPSGATSDGGFGGRQGAPGLGDGRNGMGTPANGMAGMGLGISSDSDPGNSNSVDSDGSPMDGGQPSDGQSLGGARDGLGKDGNGNGGQVGGAGGLLGGGDVDDELAAALKEDADSYRWVAATVGSQNAASYQLATECSVMPIGGFNGSDPSPTLEQFQEWVSEGLIHYFIGGGVGGGTQIGGSDTSSQITAWVEENFTATTIGAVTVYDMTQSAG